MAAILAPSPVHCYDRIPHAPRDPFNLQCGDVVGGAYRIKAEIGRGNFARVWKAYPTSHGNPVALKMLKREYVRDARAEVMALEAIKQADPDQAERVVRCLQHFRWAGTWCMVLPLLGPTLASRSWSFGVQKCGIERLQLLSSQLASALRFLHVKCKIVHTDLKPDNILLDRDCGPKDGIGTGWVVADLGSSSFYNPAQRDTDLITTRPYRAYEVLHKRSWGPAADMWSVGCVLGQVWLGKNLFDAADDESQLAQIHARLGVSRGTPIRTLSEITRSSSSFSSLLTALLDPDQGRRMDAAAMCRHRFCSAVPARLAQLQHQRAVPRVVQQQRLPRRGSGSSSSGSAAGEAVVDRLARAVPRADQALLTAVSEHVEVGRLSLKDATTRLREMCGQVVHVRVP